MGSRIADAETSRKLVALWQETGPLLERIREAELAAQSPEESRIAAYDMLQFSGLFPTDPEREKESGLVEMQRIFARARKGERR